VADVPPLLARPLAHDRPLALQGPTASGCLTTDAATLTAVSLDRFFGAGPRAAAARAPLARAAPACEAAAIAVGPGSDRRIRGTDRRGSLKSDHVHGADAEPALAVQASRRNDAVAGTSPVQVANLDDPFHRLLLVGAAAATSLGRRS
jgi:hypothetical protein